MFQPFTRARRAGMAVATVALASLVFTGGPATSHKDSGSAESQRQQINAAADNTLSRLYQAVPGSQQMVQQAKGVLVFPSVVSASFIVGAQYGKGVLQVGGRDVGYYSNTGGSVGFQAGAQSQAIVLLFMTEDALNNFRNSNGWTAGVDASVAVATVGANGRVDTATAQKPVVGFVLTNAGLAAGVSFEGAKISKLDL